MKLNLGSGTKPIPGYVNVDMVDGPLVDVPHDLDDHPWPFLEDTVEEIVAFHVFEHVVDPIGFMEQCWISLVPDGLLHIEVPNYTSRNAFTDPTHRRYCTIETFDYWVPGTWLWNSMGEIYHRNCPFRHEVQPVERPDLQFWLRKVDQ